MTTHPDTKWCSGCFRRLQVKTGVTFNKKTGTPDGLQPWCRECDARQKLDRKHGFKNFVRAMRQRGLGEEKLWCREMYEKMMSEKGWECHWCGSAVDAWSGGYWVDRINSARGYEPDNTVPCCWPCNHTKSNSNPIAFILHMEAVLAKFPRGRVPHDSLSPKFRKVDWPNLHQYVVLPAQQCLFGAEMK